MTARTARALRGFFHPAAGRRVLWHVEERARTRELMGSVTDPGDPRPGRARRSTASRSGSRRLWGGLRAQVVHGDLTLENLLVDGEDVDRRARPRRPHPLDARLRHRRGVRLVRLDPAGRRLFRMLRLFLDGYRSVTPLEPEELGRARRHDRAPGRDDPLHLALARRRPPRQRGVHPELGRHLASLLRQFEELGPEGVTRRLGGPAPPPDTDDLARRRGGGVRRRRWRR